MEVEASYGFTDALKYNNNELHMNKENMQI